MVELHLSYFYQFWIFRFLPKNPCFVYLIRKVHMRNCSVTLCKNAFLQLHVKINYSRESNKHGGTLINFYTFFQPTHSYSIPYVYQFQEKFWPNTLISFHTKYDLWKISPNIYICNVCIILSTFWLFFQVFLGYTNIFVQKGQNLRRRNRVTYLNFKNEIGDVYFKQ